MVYKLRNKVVIINEETDEEYSLILSYLAVSVMGCGGSDLGDLPSEWISQFDALKLTHAEVGQLLKIYQKMDVDRSGSIDLHEMFRFLQIEKTPFTQRVFTIFDADGTGRVDFREFVLAMWNYCTLGNATLDIFTFDIYDEDGGGSLSMKEVCVMLEDIYGSDFKKNSRALNVMHELKNIESHGGNVM